MVGNRGQKTVELPDLAQNKFIMPFHFYTVEIMFLRHKRDLLEIRPGYDHWYAGQGSDMSRHVRSRLCHRNVISTVYYLLHCSA